MPIKLKNKKEKILNQKEENNKKPQSKEDEIINLLKENLKTSQEILRFNKKISNWVFWQRIRGWFYFVIIFVIPIIFAIFYLPPMLKNFYKEYQNLWPMFFNNNLGIGTTGIKLDFQQLEQIKNIQKSGLLK